MSIVLDASAVLAIIFKERGADEVLRRADGACLSSVNLFEALAKARILRGIDPGVALDRFEHLGIDFVPFDEQQAMIASALPHRIAGRGLAMADRACLALAIDRGLPVLTGDRLWTELDIGVPIELFR